MKHINKRSIDGGSCNFCNRYKVTKDGLTFPYKFIYEITGQSNVVIRMCGKCYRELIQQKNRFIAKWGAKNGNI